MTLDQARAHLEGIASDRRGQAESLRRLADDYKRSANECDDADLRRSHFDSSSRLFADARQLDRDAEAIAMVLGAASLDGLVREAAEIMNITYAGNFPAGIESFLVRADKALAG